LPVLGTQSLDYSTDVAHHSEITYEKLHFIICLALVAKSLYKNLDVFLTLSLVSGIEVLVRC